MARIRYLKPDFFTDEDLAELSFQTRLTFAGLWCHADKAGRLEDRPKFLKAMIFPYDSVDMEKQLATLSQGKHGNGVPFIQRYEVDGVRFIQIVTWEKHQKPHHTEAESKIPPAPPLNIMGMGMEKQLNPSEKLKNGETTVKRRLKIPDDEWIKELEEKTIYSHLRVKDELQRCMVWFEAKGITVTRQRFLNWLNNPKYNPRPLDADLDNKPPIELVKVKCQFCGVVHGAKEDHKCDPEQISVMNQKS